jgi:hypothetical protein
MKVIAGRWLMGLVVLFVLAGIYTPSADAQVVVKVGHSRHYHHRHYHHRRYRR